MPSVIGTYTDITAINDQANAVGVQADGKIVAVGTAGAGASGQTGSIAIARYNSDLSLDTSYGVNGVRLTNIGNNPSLANAMVIQAGDGKTVVVGSTNASAKSTLQNFAIARYTTAGALDPSFGGGKGYVTTDVAGQGKSGNNDSATAMAIDGSGNFVVAGSATFVTNKSTTRSFALARYTPTGALDTTFNPTGKLPGTVITTVAANMTNLARAVAIQPDGKIVVAGQTQLVGATKLALVRYNANGSLDTSFGTGGIVTVNLDGHTTDSIRGIAIDSNGNIVAVGHAAVALQNIGSFEVSRFTSNGALDTTFGGGNGFINTDILADGNGDFANAVSLQSDGKIVICGTTSQQWALVARLNTDGSFDSTFNGTGYTTVDFAQPNPPNGSWGYALALAPNGSYVIAGLAFPFYSSQGSNQTAFGVGIVDPSAPLLADSLPTGQPSTATITTADVQPLLAEAMHRWQTAGVDTTALNGIDIRIADLGGLMLGQAASGAIWLDDNAAGWGWFVDPTPWDDSEFTTPGDQGEQNRTDLLSVLMHELGHVLGHDHDEGGVMVEKLSAGERFDTNLPLFNGIDGTSLPLKKRSSVFADWIEFAV